MRASTSRPSCTTWPSRLEMIRVRGSCVDTDRAREARWLTAGSMCWVWNAPATLSGISRALAGGSPAKASSCSSVPAATTWPGPLSLAATSPWRSIAARTSSRSPPSTAVIPVGVAAAASAIARPRSRTRTIACSAVIARAPAAAVSSPTLCPATAPMRANASAGDGKSSSAATRPVATSSGWAISVRRISSASASVPAWTRSIPATVDSQRKREAKVGSSSQGARKPGDWAPWPGATMTSTTSTLPKQSPRHGSDGYEVAGRVLVGTLQIKRRAVARGRARSGGRTRGAGRRG